MKPIHGPVASQPARPDPAIIIQTLDFLEEAFKGLRKEFDLRNEADLFADAYEWLAEDDRPVDQRNLADFTAWQAKRQAAVTGGEDEDEGRGVTRKAS